MAKTVGNSKTNNSGTAGGKRADETRPKAKAKQSKVAATRARARSDKAKTPAKGKTAARPGEKKGLAKFMRDVRVEMSKVTWPTRRDLLQSTLVVLVAVTIVGFYIAGVDQVFARLMNAIKL